LRYVKSAAEISLINSIYARRHLLAERSLRVLFETTPAAVRELLPPPLQPTPEPLGSVVVGEIGNSNCAGPYLVAALYVRAQYQDIVGNYCVSMSVSTPEALTYGHQLYGEPTKLAKVIFEDQDEHVWGSAERHDVRYLSLRGRLTEDAPTGRQESSTFHFKFLPRPDGNGFDTPPHLVQMTSDSNVQTARKGRGELVFRDSPHDPVADIPVQQVVEALFTEGHTYTGGRILCAVDPDAFLPYAFSRIDSFDLVAEGTYLHAHAARKTRDGKGQWRNGH